MRSKAALAQTLGGGGEAREALRVGARVGRQAGRQALRMRGGAMLSTASLPLLALAASPPAPHIGLPGWVGSVMTTPSLVLASAWLHSFASG